MLQGSEVQVSYQLKGPWLWTFLYAVWLQISHKTSKKGLKNIQKSIAGLSHLAAAAVRDIHNFGRHVKIQGGNALSAAPPPR